VEAGSVTDLAAAIAELAGDDERRARLAARGYEVARERTWGALVRRYEHMYTALSCREVEEYRSGE
jgi:glycosyltransferase involved in cell wall biosynthesis